MFFNDKNSRIVSMFEEMDISPEDVECCQESFPETLIKGEAIIEAPACDWDE